MVMHLWGWLHEGREVELKLKEGAPLFSIDRTTMEVSRTPPLLFF
jgi:hypothetical protein